MGLAKYSKLIMAVIGLLVIVLGDEVLGVASLEADRLFDVVVMFATGFGVWAVPNKDV